MTDPNTPTTPSSNPQDLIDQALGGTPTTPTVTPEPTPAVNEPTLPTPEPLTPPAATEEAPASTEPVLPPTETVPTELTSAPVTPMMEEPPVDTKPMGEDMPLAFAAAAPVDTAPTKAPETYIEPVNSTAVVPPILTTPTSDSAAPKKKSKKLKGLVVGLLIAVGLIGGVGLFGYQKYGSVQSLIAAVFIPKFTRVDGEVVRNPAWEALEGQDKADNEEARNESLGGNNVEVQKGNKGTDPASCSGCLNGGWMVWRDGECKITGICGSNVPGKDTENPAIEAADDAASCSKSGGTWCGNVVDAKGVSHAFCGSNNGKACYQLASERGITVIIGSVKCKESNGTWVPDGVYTDVGLSDEIPNPNKGKPDDIYGDTLTIHEQVDRQCKAQAGSFTALGNKEMWICPVGTSVACTANVKGAKRFYGNPANGFCGVIQVDTGTGHTSYSSTESCDEEDTPNPSTPPTITTNPTLMCTGLTRTPTTTPAIGDKLTFTCVGASTPAGSVNLSYKFRYSLNSGAYLNLTNKTATTSELTIAACGNYSVECQACGTINGVLTCDPTWAGATTQ